VVDFLDLRLDFSQLPHNFLLPQAPKVHVLVLQMHYGMVLLRDVLPFLGSNDNRVRCKALSSQFDIRKSGLELI